MVCGAGGFIGGHLTAELLRRGCAVRAVDSKPLGRWDQVHGGAQNLSAVDLSHPEHARSAMRGCQTVYNLAADMGGIGFITGNRAQCMLSVLASTHLLVAAAGLGVQRFFYASSACIYPTYRQDVTDVVALREEDAYPADCEDGYGWEKLFTERMCRHFFEDYGLEVRIARFHNVYGPHGTYAGGREKAPAAICRKVATAKQSGELAIEIWGDGKQTRSFMYVDDAVEGILRLSASDYHDPINIGSDRLITVDDLVSIVEDVAGVQLERSYLTDAPQGVRGRNSDNARIREVLDWEPTVDLETGLARTYTWIYDQLAGV